MAAPHETQGANVNALLATGLDAMGMVSGISLIDGLPVVVEKVDA